MKKIISTYGWSRLDSINISEDEIEQIAHKLGYDDGLTDDQAEEVANYYETGFHKDKPDSFTYLGISVTKLPDGSWKDSKGHKYMSYLTKDDIKQWISQDIGH